MPDEGAPTYQDMLANMQKGLLFIEQEFGSSARPKVAWSIDPFGHSTTPCLGTTFSSSVVSISRRKHSASQPSPWRRSGELARLKS